MGGSGEMAQKAAKQMLVQLFCVVCYSWFSCSSIIAGNYAPESRRIIHSLAYLKRFRKLKNGEVVGGLVAGMLLRHIF